MAPLPPNTTARVFFDYVTANTAGVEHTVAWRMPEAVTEPEDVQAAFADFLTALGAATLRVGWRVLRARYQEPLSDFSFPVPLITALETFVGTSAVSFPTNREAEEWTWQGRSPSTGRRVDFSLYGITSAPPTNFRYPAGGASPAWVAATVNALQSFDLNGVPGVIDGSVATWYRYVNFNANSYWERRLRTS